MNKKFVLIVFVLLAGAVFLTACQSDVGAKINAKDADNGNAQDRKSVV